MTNIDSKSYLLVLTKLRKAILEGKINSFKMASNLIDSTSNAENQVTLKACYDAPDNPLRNTNLAILACQHNQTKILEYLFGDESRILHHLSVVIKGTTILPNDEDEAHHNAFYYAIRSGNIALLDTLIKKWPDNYFVVHLEELDEIISIAYEELKLMNVALPENMEIFVENKLMDLRFFSTTSGKDQNYGVCINNIKERIELILQNINLLKADYSNTKVVDGKFIFVAKFIAQNIHTLKQKFKSSYDRLPWEEMEFCLIAFVSSYIKQQEINIFYRATLKKAKILFHLENFAKKLEDEKEIITGMKIGKLAELPQLKREEVIAKIISSNPEFEELYSDFQSIRDVHSINRINVYVKSASLADPGETEGQAIITRSLIIVGEYLKNSLESPNLSSIISEFLILSVTQNTRDIVVDLQNSLSYPASLLKENSDLYCFFNVQNDARRMGGVITDILFKKKVKTIRLLLERIMNSKNAEEIKETIELLGTVQLDGKMMSGNFNIIEQKNLKKLVKELSDIVTDKTTCEKELFRHINDIINSTEAVPTAIRTDFILGFLPILSLGIELTDSKSDHDIIRAVKLRASKILDNINPKMGPSSLKKIADLANQILDHLKLRTQKDQVYEASRIICEILCITEFDPSDVQWFEELRDNLNKNISKDTQKKAINVTEKETNDQLTLQLTELQGILSRNSLSGSLVSPSLSLYKSNKKLQAIIEMHVLDILSILNNSRHCLEDNILFLEDNTPLLTGKCLIDHLTHDTVLLKILLADPSRAVLLNARKLAEMELVESKKMFSKLMIDDPCKLKAKFDHGLVTIANQEKMFVAAEEGNLEGFKVLLNNGADINSKSITYWTTLHFAAKGPSLEVVKFIADHNISVDMKDIDGQSPLHIAAANGRQDIIEFLVNEAGFNINDLNNKGKTPLHVAAQNGDTNSVEVLLKNKAKCKIQDFAGHSALHCAIINNHLDVVKILIQEDENVDSNEAIGGITLLLEGVEFGNLELVNFLLQGGADIHARTNKNWTSLHIAASNGHLEIVKALIHKGADVNARVFNGCTPLHYAVICSDDKIVEILVKYGANVDAGNRIYHNTALHYATNHGHEKIVRILLENKASANVVTVEGLTPLHFAVHNSSLEIVVNLLKHGANVLAKDKNCATPLHHAAESGHKEIVALLIQNGVEINAVTNDNSNALHLAAGKGHTDVVDLLIKNNAVVNVPNDRGVTPLHKAAMNGERAIMDLLIKSEAKVDDTTRNGTTPLHIAVLYDNKVAAAFLIENEANINAKSKDGLTPLHLAAREGHQSIVQLLINNKAQLDVMDVLNNTPLFAAVEEGNTEIIKMLTSNGANVNLDKLLLSASICHHIDIIEILLLRGANFDAENSEALFEAILAGHNDIVEIFLKHFDCINIRNASSYSALHLAAIKGDKKIVKALIRSGADINSLTDHNVTPICFAVRDGHEEIVKMLIAGGANVNFKSIDGFTPLHIAASSGHINIAKVLLENKAKLNVIDNNKSTPLNYAVRQGHLQLVKMFLQCQKVHLNAKDKHGFTLLHIASAGSTVEILKYLVDEGCDINAIDIAGTKPIHVAAREGRQDIVEFFVNKGLSINEHGDSNRTLLHYAIVKGNLKIVKYLIEQSADVNAQDCNGITPMHVGACFNYKDIIKVLFKNGAAYNTFDKLRRIPLDLAKGQVVKNFLTLTDKLFESVKQNNASNVMCCITEGAFINGKNSDNVTVLHIAASKGYTTIVNILLQNKGNPNVVTNNGMTPLHYAAKFCHVEIIKTLLSKSAIYNALTDSGQTPSDFTKNEKIISLLKLVDELFTYVRDNNPQVIDHLNNMEDIFTIKAIMGARNRENKTLIVFAMHGNFTQVENLKQISQGDVSSQINSASQLLRQDNYPEALNIFQQIYINRIEILGTDSPGTLDIQAYIAEVAYKEGNYRKSLRILLTIFKKENEILGWNDNNTLSTGRKIASVMHKQGNHEVALNIYQGVYRIQKELLGLNHPNTLDCRVRMALSLQMLQKYEEALHINREVFEIRKNVLGANHEIVIRIQNNIAAILASQGNYEEALKVYKEVLEKNMAVFGYNAVVTLRILYQIVTVFYMQKKYREALDTHQLVLRRQKNIFGPNNPEPLNNKLNSANILFDQGKWINAFKVYTECFDQAKAVFGPTSRIALNICKRLELIGAILELENSTICQVLQHLQKDISVAASHGDTQTLQSLLKDGFDANDKDIYGRTPLYFAIRNGHVSVVNFLLEKEADVTQVTKKGDTSLHTAATEGNNEIVEILLGHVRTENLNDFINLKATASGAAALHVAARNGSLDIAKSLLKNGAIYNIENNEGKSPLDLSKDQDVINLLKLVEELFKDSRDGNAEIVDKIRRLKLDEFLVATNCRNEQGNTLLQVSMDSKHKNVAIKLLQILDQV